ncbi:MAG: ATP-grasp domain-containing protein [Terriglobia bacterium]
MLLLDGYSTRTLACVRSWGKHHVPFAVGGETRWDMSLLSRYSKQTFVYTSPKRNLSGFVQDVNRYCREFAADSVFPTSEAAIMACSKYRNELSCVPIIPSERAIETTFCKANTLKLAKSLGISVPTTVHVSRASWDEIGALQLKFPVAVKSASSEVIHSGKAETSHKTAYAFNRGELERECASRLEKGQTVLVQEYIDGYGVGVSGLFAEGHPVVVLGHRRIRESNPLGGPSAVAETIPVEPRLLEAATSLLRTVGFSGPAMVEYKIDRRCGQPYLMEINGRFWGTVMLASAAGLDLPYLYWKMLNGIEVKPGEKRYKIGIKGRYLVGDTKWLLVCLRGKPALCPGEFPTRWASVRSYVGSFFDPRTTELIFAREDPMPFFGRVMQELI